MSVCIISFSGRADGNCAQIARYLQELTGGELFLFSGLTVHPCGTCDYECFKKAQCPNIEDDEYRVMDAIAGSDVTYFVLPNYCGGPCANYYIFNERSVCYFHGDREKLAKYMAAQKKAIVVTNSGHDNFRRTLQEQHSDKELPILFLGSGEFKKSSVAGDLITVPEVRERIREFTLR